MAKTATINTATAKKIIIGLERIDDFKKQILLSLPDGILPYGSKLWWEKEALEADEDIKTGRVHGPFKNADDLIKSLHEESAKLR